MTVERFPSFSTLNNKSTKKEFSYKFDLKRFISYLTSCKYANESISRDKLIDEINRVNNTNYRVTIKRKMKILLGSYLFNEYYYLFVNNTNCITIDNTSYSLNCIYPRELVFKRTDTDYIFLLNVTPINESCEEDYTIDRENNTIQFKSSSDILLELKFRITDIDLFDEDKLLFNLLMNYLEFQERKVRVL